MTRRSILRALLGGALWLPAAPLLSQGGVFLYGQVVWHTGPAAHGLEVRLVRGGRTVAATFTDRRGYFAFSGVQGSPGDFRIVVASSRATLADQPVPSVPRGSRLPTITLR